jgi:hypothetical protein
LILNELGFDAIYILVDGVDAYIETAKNQRTGLKAISWLLENAMAWEVEKIYMKFFLPQELLIEIKGFNALLTSKSNITIIKWDVDALSEVIQQRLQEASGGKFSSLRAISTIPLRGAKFSPEKILALQIVELGNPNPRDLIKTVQRLFVHHIQQTGIQEKLSPEDLAAACNWIRVERSKKTHYA